MKVVMITLLGLLLFVMGTVQAQELAYYCPPCGSNCDKIAHQDAGDCPHCGMKLEQKTKEEQMQQLKGKFKVAIYVHEGMEILDFAGPVEVFTIAGFEVFTFGLDDSPIVSQGMVTIQPEYTLENCPKADMLVFVGGNSSDATSKEEVINWLEQRAEETEIIYSVCTGAFFLAKAGLLDGQKATTFHSSIDLLREIEPNATILEDVKVVDNGKIITAAGVSSGMDGALYLVQKLLGANDAQEIADYMEYDWKKEEVAIN